MLNIPRKGCLMLTEAQVKFVELEKKREEVKQYFKDLEDAAHAVADKIGIGGYFQDEEGTVYKMVVPTGKWVTFETYSYVRTRRGDEKQGTLSMKEAVAAGFEVR